MIKYSRNPSGRWRAGFAGLTADCPTKHKAREALFSALNKYITETEEGPEVYFSEELPGYAIYVAPVTLGFQVVLTFGNGKANEFLAKTLSREHARRSARLQLAQRCFYRGLETKTLLFGLRNLANDESLMLQHVAWMFGVGYYSKPDLVRYLLEQVRLAGVSVPTARLLEKHIKVCGNV